MCCSIGMIPLDSGLSPISASKWAVHYWWFFVLLVLAPWPRGAVAETSKRKAGVRCCWGVESDYTIRHALDPQHPVFRNLATDRIWSPIVSLSPLFLVDWVTLPRQIVNLTDLCFVPFARLSQWLLSLANFEEFWEAGSMLPSLGGLDITFNLCFALELAVRWISEARQFFFSPHKWIRRNSFSLGVIPCFFLVGVCVFFQRFAKPFRDFLLSGLHTLSRLWQPCLQVASWLQIDVVLLASQHHQVLFLCQLSSFSFWIGLMT